ncbi:MAG: efflux RND transporter periplasmic adaptor subunit [Bacillota bacterium]
MEKWKIISFTVVSLSFIALNGYLIEKEDSKVQHTVYVENWTRVQKDDVVETFETDGIIMPQEEYDIYFHDTDKEFQRFIVKEGDIVTAGTPLFEYTTPELDKLKETFEVEKQQVEGEIAGIEEYISTLLDYQSSIPSLPSSVERDAALVEGLSIDERDATLEVSLNIDEQASSDMIISTIEQEIYKQELEKSKLEEEVKKYDSQLSNINEQKDSAMMVSEIDGTVKEVNEKLGNPVVTIASNVLAVEGLLTENQFKKAETGMQFSAAVAGEKKQLEGTLGKIHSYPVNEPAIGQENHYRFEATITEPSESLAIGSKAAVSVVTAEAIGVLSVRKNAIQNVKNPYVYQLNANGRITKQSVQTGLNFDGIQEITKGAEIGEVMMLSRDKVPQNKAHFVTEMKPGRIKKSTFEDISTHEKLETFLIGLIEK